MGSTFTQAATPKYVGIKDNDTYIWDTTYDEEPLEDYIEDSLEEEGYSEPYIEIMLDRLDVQEELVRIKIVVLDVDTEEKNPWGEDGVRIIYNYYMMEENEEWDLEQEDETFAIWDYDDNIYADNETFATGWGFHFFDFEWQFHYTYEPHEEPEYYKFLKGENPWFISTKVDWSEVVEELEETYEDDEDYDEVSISREDNANKLEIALDEDKDDDIGEVSWIIEYDDNGVLMYYEWQYDGDPIVIVDRQFKFVYDYFWYIVGGIAAVIAVIVIIIIKVKK